MLNELVGRNLALMTSTEPGGMRHLLKRTNWDVAAGAWRGSPYVAANFVYHADYGLLLAFADDLSRVPDETLAEARLHPLGIHQGFFHVARHPPTHQYGILDATFFVSPDARHATRTGRAVLRKTLDAYNKVFAFDLASYTPRTFTLERPDEIAPSRSDGAQSSEHERE